MACGLLQLGHRRHYNRTWRVYATPPIQRDQGGIHHETSGRFDRGARARRRQHPCRARDRADATLDPLAPDLELPEEPGNDLRRRRILRRAREQAHRRQIQHPRLRGRRPCACFPGTRCRSTRHRRALPHRDLLLCRQGPHLRFRHRAPLRAHHPPAECVDVPWRRHRYPQCVLQGLRRHRLPGREHRRADGRMVQESGQHLGRLQGPEDAHPRPGRTGDGADRRGAAGAPRRRHLSGARTRRDRCHRMGRSL